MSKLKFEYKITIAYLIIGFAWVLFSDKLLYSAISDTHLQSDLQIYKGWFYVVVTAILFFFLIKRYLVKLRKAEQKALESDRLKSAFLTNLNHEIRTPMNGILGFSELIRNSELTGEQQQEYLKVIEKSGERVLELFSDLILLAKIDSGQIGITKTEVNINEISQFLSIFFKSEAEKKGLQISVFNSLSDSESIIETDKEKVFAVLSHLVKNAIKYSINGTIEVGYIKKMNFLEFFVKDKGIGIPKEKQEEIFNRFVQADNCLSKSYEGAGLGLSIAKALIEMLGGKIWLESQENVGSDFYFTIPYVQTQNSGKK
ncbi:MAG: ATP-binding protein [Bacteroidales bacterium]